ncbi:unnamed protein product [Clonostachys byssicola]|uniref:Uncharacterized protein n=1 Tax=Clonostachys byssicola TaxID=160290 RepID=A0A9N9XZB8_9HYPO|nr:unnamed protein product [Clonostachys byssicola]
MEVFSLQISRKLWNVPTSVLSVPSSLLRCAYLARAQAPTMVFHSQRSRAAGSLTSWIVSCRSCARKSIILLSTRHSIGSPAFQIPRMQSRYSSEAVAIPPHDEMNTSSPSSLWRRGNALTCELTSAKASFEAAPLIQIQPGSLASCSGLSDGRADAEAVSIRREVMMDEASTGPKALSSEDAWKKGMKSMAFMIMSMLPMPCVFHCLSSEISLGRSAPPPRLMWQRSFLLPSMRLLMLCSSWIFDVHQRYEAISVRFSSKGVAQRTL